MPKIALCIGNAAYREGPLTNPCNDARDITDTLQALGFIVRCVLDASRLEMDNVLRAFSSDLNSAQVGLFFYAGHGMQIQGANYLTAVDTDFCTEIDAKHSSLPLDKVLDVLDRGANSTSIVLLDACRNNPYERRWRGTSPSGLAAIYAPRGTIVAYATSPGQTALDGTGRNGAFTAALLLHINTVNVAIEDLFKRVRNTLSASTLGKQISWEHTCLMGDFFFNPGALTGDMATSYSPDAKADASFTCHGGRPLSSTLEGLRSHYWDRQNAVIRSMALLDLQQSSPDELFVLGRNLYQTACGGSFAANSYFSSLRANLKVYDDETAFHVLNGMLFEIYFSSDGCLRSAMKGERLEEVYYIEEDPQFGPSFGFCRNCLLPHREQLFYLPLDLRDVLFNAVVDSEADGSYSLLELHLGGENIMFDSDGQPLPNDSNGILKMTLTVQQMESTMSSLLAIPRRHLRLTYSSDIKADDTLLLPYGYRLLRQRP